MIYRRRYYSNSKTPFNTEIVFHPRKGRTKFHQQTVITEITNTSLTAENDLITIGIALLNQNKQQRLVLGARQ